MKQWPADCTHARHSVWGKKGMLTWQTGRGDQEAKAASGQQVVGRPWVQPCVPLEGKTLVLCSVLIVVLVTREKKNVVYER